MITTVIRQSRKNCSLAFSHRLRLFGLIYAYARKPASATAGLDEAEAEACIP